MTARPVEPGRSVVVTGAGRGIGRAVACGLARHGWRVLALDNGCGPDGVGSDEQAAEDTALQIRAEGGIALWAPVDVTDRPAVEAAIERAVGAWGSIDAAVNVAGVLRLGDIYSTTDADWDLLLDVNLGGAFNVNRCVTGRWMRDRASFGRVLNFTSAAGLEGHPQMLAYSTTKAGLIGMTLSMANALAGSGATVNAVAPTAATRMALTGMGIEGSEAELDVAARERLGGMGIEPDAVVPLVAYLLSDHANHLTGQVFSNRGWSYALLEPPSEHARVAVVERSLDGAVTELDEAFGPLCPSPSRWAIDPPAG